MNGDALSALLGHLPDSVKSSMTLLEISRASSSALAAACGASAGAVGAPHTCEDSDECRACDAECGPRLVVDNVRSLK